MLNDTINLIKNLFIELFKLFDTFFERFKDYFYIFIDYTFNGKNYKYIISFILLLFGLLIYLLLYNNVLFDFNKTEEIEKIKSQMKYEKNKINYKNKIKEIYESIGNNTKNANIIFIIFAGIFLSFFYFFVYRKDGSYDYIDKSILKTAFTGKQNNNYKRKYDFSKENFLSSIVNPLQNLLASFLYIAGSIIILVTLFSIIFYAFHIGNNSYNILKNIIFVLITIVCLSIIAYGLNLHKDDTCFDQNKTFENYELIFCIIKNLIFFIPCLLTIFIEKLNNDIKLTPSPVYILFFILLFLIIMVFILPILYKYLLNSNKHSLLEDGGPVYLNKKKEIGKYQYFNNETSKLVKNKGSFSIFEKDDTTQYNLEATIGGKPNLNNYNYSYSISFYLYLNPQDRNTSYSYNKEEGAELFNYGCKPIILYNGKKQQIIIKSKSLDNNSCNQSDVIFKSKDEKYGNVDIKFQKWLYFVINYENGIIDIFIDGKLVASKPNIPDFLSDDKITIGEDNGIHGSIKEIYYYNSIRSKEKIEFMYDLIKN